MTQPLTAVVLGIVLAVTGLQYLIKASAKIEYDGVEYVGVKQSHTGYIGELAPCPQCGSRDAENTGGFGYHCWECGTQFSCRQRFDGHLEFFPGTPN